MPTDEFWLVARAQSGDRDAMDELIRATQNWLSPYIVRLVGNPASADDVLQETLVRLYRKLPRLDEPRVFRPWAYRIASREAFRFLKRQRTGTDRWAEPPDVTEVADPAPLADTAPSADAIERLVERASPASRAVLLLHYQHDLSIEEVAAVLGIAAGTVKSRLAYGLQSLRKAAEARGDD